MGKTSDYLFGLTIGLSFIGIGVLVKAIYDLKYVELKRTAIRDNVFYNADKNKDSLVDQTEMLELGRDLGLIPTFTSLTPNQLEKAVMEASEEKYNAYLEKEKKK